MARLLHMLRLLRTFTANPSSFLKATKSLPDYLDAREFARIFPATSSADAAPFTNPLVKYFDRHTEGRGIWKWRHYLDVYHRHLQNFVNREVVLAEIGVFSGGSLDMWQHYFGNEIWIHGIDLDESTRNYASDRVRIHMGDQEDRDFWRQFRKEVPILHVMIDDGGHSPQQQRVSMEEILPHLQPGGVYICEDIIGESNDFSSYVGGLIASLNSGVSALESPASGFQRAVYSVHCYPFITVVERTDHNVGSFLSQRHGTVWQPSLVVRDEYGKIAGRGG
jgi:hypothetical protein